MVESAETVADAAPDSITSIAEGRLAPVEPDLLVSLERIMLGPRKERAYLLGLHSDGTLVQDTGEGEQTRALTDAELAEVRGVVDAAESTSAYHANERVRGGWFDVVTIGGTPPRRIWVRNASTELTTRLASLLDWGEDADEQEPASAWSSLRSRFRR